MKFRRIIRFFSLHALPTSSLGLLGILISFPAQALTPAQIAAKATPSVVLIRVNDGLGSGFAVGGEDRIVTNLHVIKGAQKATVVTNDGRELTDVRIRAADPTHDLVVLQVNGANLVPLPLGNAQQSNPGDHVVAIGHPLGLGDTVSDGLVSAVRQLPQGQSLLQISAPISPGSSGGPVFNDAGEVIGISTLIITRGQNLNFAVPAELVKPLLLSKHTTALTDALPSQGPRRDVPHHPIALLDDCPDDQLKLVIKNIDQAINLGAPLYNEGQIEACYRIYAGAALDTDKKISACTGVRKALLDGVAHADASDDWTTKAWAMRDAFDGVIEVTQRKLNEGGEANTLGRDIPHHGAELLKDCPESDAQHIAKDINSAINSGAPLYNSGAIEACYRIYAGVVSDVDRKFKSCSGVKQALHQGLSNADQRNDFKGKSWAMRDAFDGLLQVFPHPASAPQSAPSSSPSSTPAQSSSATP